MSGLYSKAIEDLSLAGFVDRKQVKTVIRLIRKREHRRPRTAFLLDCRAVHDFSGCALAALARIRQQLQWQGSDLALTNCSGYVKARLAVPLFESLLWDRTGSAASYLRQPG